MQNEPHGYQFHRLLRGSPNFKWWKPLVFAFLAITFGFTLQVGVTGIAMAPFIMRGDVGEILDLEQRIMALDTQDPYAISLAFVSLAVWIPAVILAAWAVGFKPIGRIWSVEFRMRWKLLWVTFGWAAFAFIVTQVLALTIELLVTPGGIAVGEAVSSDFKWSLALTTLALAFLLVPFQAAAEELMFRGAMMQVLGAWIKNPIIPILLPSLLFALAHVYDVWGMLSVGLLGVTCAWLTWRTGGLEAAISLHVVNNLGVFVILATGITGSTSQQTDTGGGVLGILIQLVLLGLYSVIVVRTFDRKHRPSHERAETLHGQHTGVGGVSV